jgi:hypothetical protein
MIRTIAVTVLAVLFFVPAAEGQVQIERRRAASASGEVSIDNDFGSVTVRGWERAEVMVRGTVAAGAEDFDLDGDDESTEVSVEVPNAWFHAAGEDAAFRSTLEVFVPSGSSVDVETVNASIDVEGVTGGVEADSVNGSVRVAGPASTIEIETMTGSIEVRVSAAPMWIDTISGKIDVSGATGEVRIESVSGPVSLAGAEMTDVRVKSTTGSVGYRGGVSAHGRIGIETFSGPVQLHLPPATRAEFDLHTFAGKIESDFCVGTPVTRERFEPFRQLHCSTGPDEFEIQVRTHDADITIAADGGTEKGAR